METLTLAGAVAGVTAFVRLVAARFGFDVSGLATVVVAGVVGAVLGYLGVEGYTITTGLVAAATAVGGFSAVDRVTKK